MKRYLICYDITDARRLGKVNRVCKEYGIPLQYSVFLAEMRRSRLEALVAELRRIVHDEDDIRIYPLHNDSEVVQLGNTGMLQDLFLGDDGGLSAILGVGAEMLDCAPE